MTRKTNSKDSIAKQTAEQHPKFRGYVIQTAWNPIARKWQQVFAEDEVPANKIVTMYWCEDRYITIPA